MLSIESPRSAITSITFLRRHAQHLVTFARIQNQIVLLADSEPSPASFTSCIMSLSFEHDEDIVLLPPPPCRASVPITSSASKPSASRIGIRNASSARRMYGICCARSGGIASRFALYPPVLHRLEPLRLRVPFLQPPIASRPLVAKHRPAHVEHRRKIFRRKIPPQLVDHVHEHIVAAVGTPVRVDIGRRRCIA